MNRTLLFITLVSLGAALLTQGLLSAGLQLLAFFSCLGLMLSRKQQPAQR